ncbi:CHAT domain-containing protein [Rostrohypoxylon terebratum]|nr:CHAT domain-containing protein [Rostrohypoxylon terebratum]
MDRVISSYATTVRSLALSRKRISALDAQKPGTTEVSRPLEACLVSMKTTPRLNELPNTETEVQAIADLLPIPKTILAQPTKEKVLEALQRCSIVHFACHGEMHADPSLSRIFFEDWEENPFSVHDMAKLNLTWKARLTYISACHAGTSSNAVLLDESVHMAGACQLAGFPAVVGSLWKVSDEYAPVVACGVYSRLTPDGTLDVRRTAQALHFAVREVRSKNKDYPIIWAPFIYFGV